MVAATPPEQRKSPLMPRKERPAQTETPRFLDPHRAEIEEADASARRGPAKPPANSPILCCECGMEYHRATRDATVAAFRAHEEPCRAKRASRRWATRSSTCSEIRRRSTSACLPSRRPLRAPQPERSSRLTAAYCGLSPGDVHSLADRHPTLDVLVRLRARPMQMAGRSCEFVTLPHGRRRA
jgi:hypothetical protein